MKRPGQLTRRSRSRGSEPRKPMKRSPIKRKKRKPSEFARIYGSKARVEFVKSLPCAACGIVGYSQNAHVLGNGGTGRKAGYQTIAPLCGPRPSNLTPFLLRGCHSLFDEAWDYEFEARFPHFDPERAAHDTEAAWQQSCERRGTA